MCHSEEVALQHAPLRVGRASTGTGAVVVAQSVAAAGRRGHEYAENDGEDATSDAHCEALAEEEYARHGREGGLQAVDEKVAPTAEPLESTDGRAVANNDPEERGECEGLKRGARC